MSSNRYLLGLVLVVVVNAVIHYPEEKHLANVRQLTFAGQNAEAYFSFDDEQLIFQSSNAFGTPCDQIYRMNVSGGSPSRVSTGLGVCTCAYFLPDNRRMLYASTFANGSQYCPDKLCHSPAVNQNATIQHLCNTTYTWDIYPDYDIFVVNEFGNLLTRLTNESGYDAEATLSPRGDQMVFTSMRSGDLELYTMNLDGTGVRQITSELGYDGGAFFSPDGSKLVFRASRPKTEAEIQKYKKLLRFNLVSPTAMELFVINADGSNLRQITRLGGANWAPFYHPNGKKIIFSSNFNSSVGFSFNLYLVGENGENLERITHDPKFDSFPMFSHDGKKLVFASARNAVATFELNLFIADWVDSAAAAPRGTICLLLAACLVLLLS